MKRIFNYKFFSNVFIVALFAALAVAAVGTVQKAHEEKAYFVAQMSSNQQHICTSPACLYYAHRDGYETPEEKQYYFEHITLVRRQHRDEQYRLAAELEAKGVHMDYDAKHAYDGDE
jgi:hypothetical protein